MIQTDPHTTKDGPEDLPCIFVMIRYEPQMNTRAGFERVVHAAVEKTERELLQHHSDQQAKQMIDKLHHALSTLDHEVRHKSMSIIVSPLVEKIFYFDYEPVEWSRYHVN